MIAALLAAAIWGGTSGLIVQTVTLGSLAIGLAVGAVCAVFLADVLEDPNASAALAIGTLFLVVTLFHIGGTMIGGSLRDKVPQGFARGIDAGAGTVTSMVGVALVAWLVALPLAEAPFATIADGMRSSFLMRVVQSSPPPPDVLSTFRQAFRATDFPIVFDRIHVPSIRQTSPLETDIVIASSVQETGYSTVKLLGKACGRGSEGSGWVFAPEYVATNAHVIAGVTEKVQVKARFPSRNRNLGDIIKNYDGVPVAFDSKRDIAVLHVPNLPLPPVSFTAAPAPDDLSVAILGYPENGPYVAKPGRVQQTLTANGRDIYDDNSVTREIYELVTRVRPGNSGGPMVARDGTVYGMVFAASSTDPAIGYALIGEEVDSVIRPARGRQTRTSTGSCLH